MSESAVSYEQWLKDYEQWRKDYVQWLKESAAVRAHNAKLAEAKG